LELVDCPKYCGISANKLPSLYGQIVPKKLSFSIYRRGGWYATYSVVLIKNDQIYAIYGVQENNTKKEMKIPNCGTSGMS